MGQEAANDGGASRTGAKTRTQMRVWLADLTYTQQALGADTFPLAIGCIATYAETQIDFAAPIRLFRYPEALARALAEEGPPDVMGFSHYIWNTALSLAFARRIKALDGACVVVAGGPNYPLEAAAQEAFLRRHAEIDFAVIHEGEVTFVRLIEALAGASMDAAVVKGRLAGVHALGGDGRLLPALPQLERLRDLDHIPSPYLSGKFDEFFDGRLWPLVQTKRGCPFTCTFCTEGLAYYTKIGRFGVDRVRAEIDYIGRKMAEVRARGGRNDLYIADSNFGMFREDLETARALAKTRADYGWPDHINTSTGKNAKERILETARTVDGAIVLSGSVQTLDAAALDNVRRRNISADDLMLLAREADSVGANSYCEVIVGLPGETRDAHFKTLETIVTAGFNKVIPYQLMMLPGSELATAETVAKYRMELRSRVLPRAFGFFDVCGERLVAADIEDVCVANDCLSFDDYLDCREMHLIITIFYNDVVFETVLKALTANGLPVYRWLELIRECVPGSGLAGLMDDFRRHTRDELWPDRTTLEAEIQKPGVVERYIAGKSGFNLLYSFKALAVTRNLDAMVEVVRRATARLLAEAGDNRPWLGQFLDAAIRWDALSMTDIVTGLDRDVSGTISHDLLRFIADREPEPGNAYAFESPRLFRYDLSAEQRDFVRRNLANFGDDAPGIGRLLSVAYTKKLLRKPAPADAA